jgi:hypothetical protein
MTEDEARKKACPMAKSFDAGNDIRARCVGSSCMAWREVVEERPYGVHGHTARVASGNGFCGLAGPVL